ncbi:unnamed protein product [Cyprideis torosa]|uniref:Uncharacterized protein n=1 Tax=Cyprideis torosa TaxID=163714 RepID=A0A7R8ZLV8_9CRUS|nr:unnamed protein product [Cyprideis torosa]CAG0882973.1 unnamed protein product [Cyprideis torosa]
METASCDSADPDPDGSSREIYVRYRAKGYEPGEGEYDDPYVARARNRTWTEIFDEDLEKLPVLVEEEVEDDEETTEEEDDDIVEDSDVLEAVSNIGWTDLDQYTVDPTYFRDVGVEVEYLARGSGVDATRLFNPFVGLEVPTQTENLSGEGLDGLVKYQWMDPRWRYTLFTPKLEVRQRNIMLREELQALYDTLFLMFSTMEPIKHPPNQRSDIFETTRSWIRDLLLKRLPDEGSEYGRLIRVEYFDTSWFQTMNRCVGPSCVRYWPAASLEREVPSNRGKRHFFHWKIWNCCILFDWLHEDVHKRGKDVAVSTTSELANFLQQNPKAPLYDLTYPLVVLMVSRNLFRFPPYYARHPDDDEAKRIVEDVSWPILQEVYRFFLAFLDNETLDPWLLSMYVDEGFVQQCINLLGSLDERERRRMLLIIHRLYWRLPHLRSFIRLRFVYIILRELYESDSDTYALYAGIGEILEFFVPIFLGMKKPVSKYNLSLLHHILIPLHRLPLLKFSRVQTSMIDCLKAFMFKEPRSVLSVVRGLLLFWPKIDSQKEVRFLTEIQALCDVMTSQQFKWVVRPLFRQIARCCGSLQLTTSEEALGLFDSDALRPHIVENSAMILHLTFEELNRIVEDPYYSFVLPEVENALTILKDVNPDLYDEMARIRRFRREKEAVLDPLLLFGPDVTPFPKVVELNDEHPIDLTWWSTKAGQLNPKTRKISDVGLEDLVTSPRKVHLEMGNSVRKSVEKRRLTSTAIAQSPSVSRLSSTNLQEFHEV